MYQVSITLLLFVLLLLPIQSVNANEGHKNKKPKAPVSSTQAVVSNPQIDPSIELVEVPVFGPKDFSGGLKGTINYKESFLMNENTTEGIIYVTNLSVNDYPECVAKKDDDNKGKGSSNSSKGSDSLNHGVSSSSGDSGKFLCKIKNVWVDIKKYFLEPKFVEIYFNDKKVLHKKEFIRVNTEANTGEPINVVPVKLLSENQIRVKIHGSPLAKVNVVVKALVPNKIPIASFDYSPKDLTEPVTVSFSGLSSLDPDGQIVSYVWDFADGSLLSFGSEVSHRYQSRGIYPVKLTVTDNLGSSATIVKNIEVKADVTPPILTFTSPVDGTVFIDTLSLNLSGISNEPLSNLTAQFPEDTPINILLDSQKISFSQDIVSSTDGTKALTIKATDLFQNVSTYVINITFKPNTPPFAMISASPSMDFAPVVISFDASESFDIDGSIISYTWNFADGEVKTTTTPFIMHSYTIGGDFNVILTVMDNRGATSTAEVLVKIFEKSTSTFTFTQSDNSTEINFNASSVIDPLGDVLTYTWNFGDGSSGEGAQISHTYSNIGIYEVTLTLTNNFQKSYSITQNVTVIDNVSTGDDDVSEGTPSSGSLAVKNNADKTFHGINDSITVQAIGVNLHPDLQNVTNIFVNGRRLDESGYTFTLNEISLNEFLQDGENDISIDTLDEFSLDLNLRFKIFAGNRSLTVNRTNLSGGVIRAELIDDSDIFVESVDGVFHNLPNKLFFIKIKDDTNRIGVAVVNPNDTSNVNLYEWNQGQVSQVENNDFSLGTSDGWQFENARGVIKSHVESGVVNNSNKDLALVSLNSESYRVSRVMKTDPDSRTAMFRFRMRGLNPNDSSVIVFRGLVSQKVSYQVRNLNYFGLTKTTSEIFESYWEDLSFILGEAGEPVEISMVYFPSNSLASTVMNWKFRLLQPKFAHAQLLDEPTTEIDQANKSITCILGVELYDDVRPVNKPRVLLKFLSIGAIPDDYNGGVNRILVKIRTCKPIPQITTDVIEQLNLYVQGRQISSVSNVKNVNANNWTGEFVFDSATSNSLSDLEESKKISLSVKWDSTALIQVPIGLNELNQKLSLSVPPLVRANYQANLRTDEHLGVLTDPKNDRFYGGDDWSTLFVREILINLLPEHSDIQFRLNDISKMNGDSFPPHKEHSVGIAGDFKLVGYESGEDQSQMPNFTSKKDAENILKILNDKSYGPHIGKGVLSYEPGTIGEFDFSEKFNFWNHLNTQCLHDGRLARNVLTTDVKSSTDLNNPPQLPRHRNHVHLEFRKDKIIPQDIGTIDLKINFLAGNRIEFSEQIFTTKLSEWYEVYIETLINNELLFIPITDSKAATFLGDGIYQLLPGRYKMKIIKLRKIGKQTFCSQKLVTTDDQVKVDNPEFFWIHIKEEGICDGQPLTPIQSVIELESDTGEPITPGFNVGFKSESSSISTDSYIGAGGYLCTGSNISQQSSVGGDENGLVIISNSNISKGSIIVGAARINSSQIDHTKIDSNFTDLVADSWRLPTEEELTIINDSIISDTTESEFSLLGEPPIYVFGAMKILGIPQRLGSPKAPSKILKTRDTFILFDKLVSDPPTIVGPMIFNVASDGLELRISDGSTIQDSVVQSLSRGIANPINFERKYGLIVSGGSKLINSGLLYDGEIHASNIDEGQVIESKVSESNILKSVVIQDSIVSAGSDINYTLVVDKSTLSNTSVNGFNPEIPFAADGRYFLHPLPNLSLINQSCSYVLVRSPFAPHDFSYEFQCVNKPTTNP